MSQTLKNILVVVLFGGIALLGYVLFVGRDNTSLLFDPATDPISNQLLQQANTFIQKRATIESLQLDTAILVDPRFVNLVSFSRPVPEQPVGKSTLFEPAQSNTSSQ
jgi:hypothetical protein